MSQRIRPTHQERRAYVYIRQSTGAQVLENTESTIRQYDLATRAKALGWTESSIEVIDEDLGKSGATTEGRTGLEKMAKAVAHGRAGAILALEVSRLARSSIDWQHLLKLCAVADVAVIDENTIYDPSDSDDRLLLDIKGTMSELELRWLRLRLAGARNSKARRGELRIPFPTGYAWIGHGLELDPDESVQEAIRIVLDRFRIEPSAWAVVRWAHRTGFLFPTTEHHAGGTPEVIWKPLGASRLYDVLHNPIYAGVYAYGRRPVREVIRDQKVCKIRENGSDPDGWLVRIEDSHPGYITWETFLANQEKLRENARGGRGLPVGGAPREGKALLGGILICGRCGGRMAISYWGKGTRDRYSYMCPGERQHGGTSCWSVCGSPIDAAVEDLLLETAVPDQLELALAIEEEVRRQGEALARQWGLRIERAEYEARLSERRYKAVDPDNRTVARTLERDWELKLQEVDKVRQQYETARREKRVDLSERDRAQIRELAGDLPRVWRSPTTAMADRKGMLRQVIEAIALEPVEEPERETHIKVQWKSGAVSQLRMPRPTREEWKATPKEAIVRIREWAAQGVRDEMIAERLNEAGIPTGAGKEWDVYAVRWARRKSAIDQTAPHAPRSLPLPDMHPDGRYSVRGAMKHFGAGETVVRGWIKRGLVRASQEDFETHRNAWWLEIDEQTEQRLRETPRGPFPPKRAPLPDRHSDGRYSIAGAARRFGVSKNTVRRWLEHGLVAGQQEEYDTYHGVWWLDIDEKTEARLAERA